MRTDFLISEKLSTLRAPDLLSFPQTHGSNPRNCRSFALSFRAVVGPQPSYKNRDFYVAVFSTPATCRTTSAPLHAADTWVDCTQRTASWDNCVAFSKFSFCLIRAR